MNITKTFIQSANGGDVYQFTIKNGQGVQVSCLNQGCIITEIRTPDKNGIAENIVLEFDDYDDYLHNNTPNMGGVIGRVAGRMKDGEFELDGKKYYLARNEKGNHMHGGPAGFITRVWEAKPFAADGEGGVVFSRVSDDGEEGYPGKVQVKVTYTLTDQNQLKITYEAIADKTTILNLTNHSYFNLSGNAKEDIQGHRLKVDSSRILELNEELLPTGKELEVAGTPFDFREMRRIKEGLERKDRQLQYAGGYDHPFILNHQQGQEINLYEPVSGRTLAVETEMPVAVIYTANSLTEDMAISGKKGHKHMAICLETQGFPDAVHHSSFKSIVLEKGKPFKATTMFSFGIAE